MSTCTLSECGVNSAVRDISYHVYKLHDIKASFLAPAPFQPVNSSLYHHSSLFININKISNHLVTLFLKYFRNCLTDFKLSWGLHITKLYHENGHLILYFRAFFNPISCSPTVPTGYISLPWRNLQWLAGFEFEGK